MSFTKVILFSIGIGIISLLLGLLFSKLLGNEKIKTYALVFFLIGFFLFIILEYSGAHKRFCAISA